MRFAGLLERLRAGETVICAEGYLFEFDRRGYLKSGAYVPEVVIDHPHLVKNMYEEFVHAGSDVIEAFTVGLYHLKFISCAFCVLRNLCLVSITVIARS